MCKLLKGGAAAKGTCEDFILAYDWLGLLHLADGLVVIGTEVVDQGIAVLIGSQVSLAPNLERYGLPVASALRE